MQRGPDAGYCVARYRRLIFHFAARCRVFGRIGAGRAILDDNGSVRGRAKVCARDGHGLLACRGGIRSRGDPRDFWTRIVRGI